MTLAGLFAGLYGFFVEPALRLRVRRWKLRRSDWTAAPLKIAVISDLHVGEPYVGLDRVKQILQRTNALGADLILLLGDYAAGHRFVTEPVEVEALAPELQKLTARDGVYAVLGNHDWWDDRAAQTRGSGPNLYADALWKHGIPVLSNTSVKLQRAGVWLAGLEDQLAFPRGGGRFDGLDDLPKTLSEIDDDAPVILMAHEPDIFPKVPDRVALTLSGHTHGGQLRLFGYSPLVPSKFGNRYAYGHVREGSRDLIVSRGIGCSIMPLRFGVIPEITVIDVSA